MIAELNWSEPYNYKVGSVKFSLFWLNVIGILLPRQGHTQHEKKHPEFYQISIIMGITSPGSF